jgi:hypothetical protein
MELIRSSWPRGTMGVVGAAGSCALTETASGSGAGGKEGSQVVARMMVVVVMMMTMTMMMLKGRLCTRPCILTVADPYESAMSMHISHTTHV